MTTEAVKTDAVKTKDPFSPAFPAFLQARRGDDPTWLTKLRERAFAEFAEQGLPTRKDEAWKYTNLRPLADLSFVAAPTPDDAAVSAMVKATALGGPRIVLVNGRFSAAHSDLSAVERGVLVRALTDCVDELQDKLSSQASTEHALSRLNTAFVEDGVVVQVTAGAAATTPLELIVVNTGTRPFASYPRVVVQLGANSQLSLVETHCGRDGEVYLNDVVVDVTLADGAILDHVRVVDESDAAFHVATTRIDQPGRDSRYSSNALSFGGRLTRHDLHVTLAAEGAHADLDGLYVVAGASSVDNHTEIDHAQPHTTSSETYRGVLDERARGTFFGRIIVRPDAQKISAEQQNKNLLLSDDALANSTPQLEIYADDVKCAHGSTIGQIDENQLFYLRSRGIDRDTARDLLTFAFANEIIDRVKIPALRDRLAHRLHHTTEDPRISA